MAQESLTEAPDMCPSSSHADPSLSRNLSSSRLNAQAPEFVPTRPTTRLVVPPPPPPPPPSGMVEYYFSDLNLATTDHLMRFINKDSEGFVPISVVASFKKIKALITSHSQLATALRNSTKLVVSEDGKKVKRQHPLTESDIEELQIMLDKLLMSKQFVEWIKYDTNIIHAIHSFPCNMHAIYSFHNILINDVSLSRIVVAENLPEDHCHQNLMKVFSAVGSVKTIRTCPPQTSNSGASSASRLGKVDGVHLANKLHAFVEYESVELAERAVAELNDERNWRSGLRVRQMVRCMPKPSQGRGKKGFDTEANCEEDYTSLPEQQANEKPVEDAPVADTHTHGHVEEHAYEKESGQRKGRSRGRGKGRGRVHSRVNNQLGTQTSNSNNSILTEQVVAKQPPGPRMPDGTRGFSMGRGKPIAVNIP
ncbi:hypothetical protein Ahy_A06g027753 isoform A [Arachis hypogaea]|uniref:HTH La-type RNA-binding domain-containing protein n=1 Tax=Arachis hypogaea TaxID=3818 RepID=A0A445CPQ4_ARAHY|nr:hypothetical protein Ahy_A06g027753 isoform A [Arachis hypogaea]